MKVENQNINIERSSEFKESTFRIKASAKAFDILSKQIYTNIPLAIIRELSTNAWDAHVDAKNTNTPFEIQLPNDINPFFSIRDYGTGLSQEDIEQLYTTYFESNKTHSNDFTGCLGIGSKSPFAYTDSFTVTSYFNGKKYIYNCFKGEEGFPKIALMLEESTDQHNGLEIAIAIDSKDFGKFKTYATTTLAWFPVQPVVKGDPNFAFPDFNPSYEGTNWKLVQSVYTKSVAIMGNIAYPIRSDHFNYNFRRFLEDNQLVLFFNIGDLEIAANREELQWEDKTIASMQSALDVMQKELSTQISQEMKDAKCHWDARILYYEMFWGAKAKLRSLVNVINKDNMVWKGEKVDDAVPIDPFTQELIECFKFELKYYSRDTCSKVNISNVRARSGVKLVINDLVRGGLTRTRTWAKEHGHDEIYYFNSLKETGSEKKKIFKLLVEHLGILDDSYVVYTSSFPKPVRQKRSPTKKDSRVAIHKYNHNYQYRVENHWTEVTIDVKQEGHPYVPIKRWKVDDNVTVTGQEPRPYLSFYITALTKLGWTGEIYGLKVASVEKIIKKNKDWIRVEDLTKNMVKKYIDKHKLKSDIEVWLGLGELNYQSEITQIYQEILQRNINSTKIKFMELAKNCKSTASTKKEFKIIREILVGGRSKFDLNFQKKEIAKQEKEILQTYPMLNLFLESRDRYYSNSNWNSKTIKTVADYIIEKG